MQLLELSPQILNNHSPDEWVKMALHRLEIEIQETYAECESSLRTFIEHAWPVVEPGRHFVGNWHIDSICRHLEAVTRGEILRLVINVPPRSSKSTVVSVMWPVWVWLQDPSRRFISGSHNVSLATRDNMKSRRLINSPWFQRGWADRFQFAGDQNQKIKYENNKTGARICFGMGSGVTGEGGDILIIDDPHNAKSAMFSTLERQGAIDMFDQELSTRLNNPDKSAIVIIMQRLHDEDLAGHVLKTGKYEHLCLPMEYEPARKCITCLGEQDPRTVDGELLCSERFPIAWVEEQKRVLGTYGASGQLQQSPVPAGGGIVKLDWFQRYNELPVKEQWAQVVQFWDTAQKANELLNCPWVCGTWVRCKNGRLYLVDVYREWMDYPRGKRMAKSLAEKYNPHAIVVEDKSTGSSLIQELKKETKFSVIPFEPEGDKVTRLSSESPAIESGKVYIPEVAPWLIEFESEIGSFPLSATMDQADMLSMALKYFHTKKLSLAEVLAGRK
ncbi:MAG TPA: phage terminase large subunit [Desulfatiglandales bacterium]|nr:phage terminase large subunit [Desulfatiglandales bacterium]